MRRITILAVLISALIFLGLTGNAFALKIKFSGSADWVTSNGIAGDGDQWLNIFNADTSLPSGTYQKVKGKGIAFLAPYESDGDFGGLAFKLNTQKGKVKKVIKKAQKKGYDDQKVSDELAGKILKVKLKDQNGDKYKGRLTFAGIIQDDDSPLPVSPKGFVDGVDPVDAPPARPAQPTTSSVPEPATMVLLGFGLLGLAGCRRIRKR